MKRYGKLIEKISSFENVYNAYLKARRGKKYKVGALRFTENLEINLVKIKTEFEEGSYKTGRYHVFTVYEPKEREIAALPFRDRVAQHTICLILEPIFDNSFIPNSYACRNGKGMRRGLSKLTHNLRSTGENGIFVLKGDVKKFFPSVNQSILKEIVKNKIKDQKVIELLNGIIDSWNINTKKGLPIGNLTSQILANVYLNELDQYVTRVLKIKYYIRYMDDFIILSTSRIFLKNSMVLISTFLNTKLDMLLNPKSRIFPASIGIDFLGFKTWSTHKRLKKASIKRMKKTIKLYKKGKITKEKVITSIASWTGHASYGNTYKLRKEILGDLYIENKTPIHNTV